MATEDTKNLPPLIDLPVYRDTYLSQERTDELCHYVWENYPDYIRDLVNVAERVPIYRTKFAKINDNLSCRLRDDEKAGKIRQISLIGMVDLIFEIDRRIRKALDLPEIEVLWKPIAPGPEGPFPPLIDLPLDSPLSKIPQEKADGLIWELYATLIRENPEAIFAQVEMTRRHLWSGEPSWIIFGTAKKISAAEDEVNSSDVSGELRRRWNTMIGVFDTPRQGMIGWKGDQK